MFFLTNTLEITAYTSFLLVWAVNLFSAFRYGALGHKKSTEPRQSSGSSPSLSVVVVTQNQEDRLVPLLHRILEQDYDDFEIIVVDNGSTDNTRIILENMEMQYEQIHHTFVPEKMRYVSQEALALTLGVKAAHHDWIVVCTPDYLPVSNRWLRRFSESIQTGRRFVLGAQSTAPETNHGMQAFSLLYEQIHFLNWAGKHRPCSCNPQNIAFMKQDFLNCKELSVCKGLLNGYLEIFVNRCCQPREASVCLDAEALVIPQSSHIPWTEERIFHKETEKYFCHKKRYRFFKGWHMAWCWILFLSTLFCAGIACLQNRWEYLSLEIILLIIWGILRTLQLQKSSRQIKVSAYGIYIPFYELGLSVSYFFNNLRYWCSNKKMFYKKFIG